MSTQLNTVHTQEPDPAVGAVPRPTVRAGALALMFLTLTLLTGCGGTDAARSKSDAAPGTNASAPSQKEAPDSPTKDRTGDVSEADAGDKDLLGVDADGDGVRDDVQRFIANEYGDNPGLTHWLESSAQLQQQILRDADDEAKSLEHSNADLRVDECVRFLYGLDVGDPALQELRAVQLNTDERSRAYLHADAWLGGTTFRMRSYKERAEECK